MKGITTDKNRYQRQLADRFDFKRISQIEPEHIESLKLNLKDLKPATVWNILDLLRRTINYGHKTKKKYAQFLPETLAQIGNAAAEVSEFK